MSRKYKTEDETLDTLLHLDGEVFPMDNGCWTKFEVKRIEPNRNIPQGIKYGRSPQQAAWNLLTQGT